MKRPKVDSLTLRMPVALSKQVIDAAKRSYRSRSAEVLVRLQESFSKEAAAPSSEPQPNNP